MTIESIISLSISTIGLFISIWAIIEARKSTNATLKQNREYALNEIDARLKEIDVEIARANDNTSRSIYAVFDPKHSEKKALAKKKKLLENQKRKLQQQQ